MNRKGVDSITVTVCECMAGLKQRQRFWAHKLKDNSALRNAQARVAER